MSADFDASELFFDYPEASSLRLGPRGRLAWPVAFLVLLLVVTAAATLSSRHAGAAGTDDGVTATKISH